MALVRPNSLKTRQTDVSTSDYVEGRNDLSDLTLEQLVIRYEEIDQQSQLFKGLILLEARSRFPSNNEFGEWVQSVPSLCGDGNQVRNRYMNFARYFKEKEMLGISLTVAYEISSPVNQEIADTIYEYAKGKNLKVAEVKVKIAELKNKTGIPSDQNKKVEPLVLPDKLQTYKDAILDDVKDLSNQDAVRVLKLCLKELQEKNKYRLKK